MQPCQIRVGAIEIDLDTVSVRRNTEELVLTPTEWDLLVCFIAHAGRVLSYTFLLEQVWRGAQSHECVRVYVQRLRAKLGDDPKHPQFVRTYRGRGYRFDVPRQPP